MSVLVIGGGVVGLSIARELHRSGIRELTVIDKNRLGCESSWAAAGMLSPDTGPETPEPMHRLCLKSNELYAAFAEELLDETGIDIEFERCGSLFLGFSETDSETVEARYRSNRSHGIPVVRLTRREIVEAESNVSPTAEFGLLYPLDGQVENRRLLEALIRYANENGINLRSDSEVTAVMVDRGRVAGVETALGRLNSQTVVLATGAWTSLINIGGAPAPFAVRPVRGQMISFDLCKPPFSRIVYSPRGYVVPRRSGRTLVGATVEDVGFEKTTTPEGAATLRTAALEISEVFRGLDVADHWAGLRPSAFDELPIIGRLDGIEGLFIATAHFRNGILLAPLTARLIADCVVGGNRYQIDNIFSPDRFAGSRSAARG